MATTKIEAYNRALDLIGVRRLESLLIDREARYALDNAYPFVLQYCLEQGIWRFAIKTATITTTTLPGQDYAFGFAHTVPADLIYTYMLGADETFSPPLMDALEADGYYFKRTSGSIFVRYTSNDASYGGSLARWDNIFAKYFNAELAASVAYQLTRSKDAAETAKMQAKETLMEARATDALMASTGILPYNALDRREFNGGSDVQEVFPFGFGGGEKS